MVRLGTELGLFFLSFGAMHLFFSRLLWQFFFCLSFVALSAQAQTTNPYEAPKREFRGAWIQCVNGQFEGLTREQMQDKLTHQLDVLKAINCNTVIFQVRAEADALYRSPYEPWSRFLTGTQGKDPGWDPLEWMVEECHNRGLELHAWINPFRAKTKGTKALASKHPYFLYPERFVKYGSLYFFDPGLVENHVYICNIVSDLLQRYDVDGLHIDDYFYPYPESGRFFDDDETFRQHSYGFTNRGDWRRNNVNNFIESLFRTCRAVKPWVKFGVSPFGIYHNSPIVPCEEEHLPGSPTRGLQNYDDLYADVLHWVNQGWVDYLVPQLYWEIGHKTADHESLVGFWSKYAKNRPLIIGQDVERTVRAKDPVNPTTNQLAAKFELQRSDPSIAGACWWYSANLVRNEGNTAYELQNNYYLTPALQPLMPHIDKKAPKKVRNLEAVWAAGGYYLFWKAPKARKEMDKAVQYAIYAFEAGEKIDLNSSTHLVTTTHNCYFPLPYEEGQESFTYVVTALDRLQNESKPVMKKVKL